ncbi:monocarboxylate transporter 3 [Strongylocentrotus purpuratus]|uniref:Uncharacterized protein n=1 Tax=Strongylocentrotus purpuratus TaxID=7668 RepID=A0A7M7HKZ6_STRPU|nr:monocarboxylate transporter 3 [Strongylocentrotus purpuratus]XP_011663047.1 monocarboxylate transporter 3 [Strongylocentrotus purpuratus]|eukprot:XP_003728401.1 PREDICTED: monocarboxylate transporter 3 [Strongylocentrotus purpuratus]
MKVYAMEGIHHEDQWRYIIILSKTLYQFLHQGLFKSFGVMIPAMVAQLGCSYSVAGLISSIHFTVTYIMCPVAQRLAGRFSKQTIAVAGGCIFSLSISCVFFTQSPLIMGILLSFAGCGNSMIFQTSYAVLQEHFGDQFGSMHALTSIGLGVGAIILPLLTYELLGVYGLQGTFLILGGLTANTIPLCATFRSPCHVPSNKIQKSRYNKHSLLRMEEESEDGDFEWDNNGSVGDENDGMSSCEPRYFLDIMIKTLALEALWKEREFVFIMLPCQLLLDIIFAGWSLFVVSFAVSVGIPPDRAPYLLIVGVVGGLLTRLLITMVLRTRPHWATILYGIFTLILTTAVFLYYISSTFYYLCACSFIAGFGLYGADIAFYACLAASVSEGNFPGVLASSFFFTGIGMASSGYITGRLYDITNSFEIVFQLFGGIGVLIFILTLIFIYRQRTNSIY